MSEPRIRSRMKQLLRASMSILGAIAGFSFFFGGGVIHAIGNVDRFPAEVLGIGSAFVCLIGIVISKHFLDDIEWQDENEAAAASENNQKN